MADPVANLLALHDHLGSIAEPWAGELHDGLDQLLAGEVATVDAAFGLANGAGQSWRQRLVCLRRDRALMEAAEGYNLPMGRALAQQLALDLGRYRASAWRFDRTRAANPYKADDRRRHFFDAFKALDRDVPERTMRAILAGQ